jgi:hypothetical protein
METGWMSKLIKKIHLLIIPAALACHAVLVCVLTESIIFKIME